MLGEKIVIALSMMFLCTLIHAVFMVAGTHALEWRLTRFGPARGNFDRVFLIWLMTLWMFIAIVIEAVLWALVYLYNPAITALPDPQTAFYFSMVTYTTLGYGDVVLNGEWRTLASVQAANGVIIFGWTTALIFYFIQQIYKKDWSPETISMYENLALLAVFVLIYSSVAGAVERTWLSGPIIFTCFGLLIGPVGLDLHTMEIDREIIRGLAEVTLALVLFTDAAGADMKVLKKTGGLPTRLLLIGLPLTILLGFGCRCAAGR